MHILFTERSMARVPYLIAVRLSIFLVYLSVLAMADNVRLELSHSVEGGNLLDTPPGSPTLSPVSRTESIARHRQKINNPSVRTQIVIFRGLWGAVGGTLGRCRGALGLEDSRWMHRGSKSRTFPREKAKSALRGQFRDAVLRAGSSELCARPKKMLADRSL